MLKRIVVIFALFYSMFNSISAKEVRQFVPDNDLWKEDSLDRASEDDIYWFNKIIQYGAEIWKPVANASKEKLYIVGWWNDPKVNANASRSNGMAVVNMYGGLFRRPEISLVGFALVMCHEIGHLYGFRPYIVEASKLSAEGQADYIGAKVCLKNLINMVEDEGEQASAFISRMCNGNRICERQLLAGESVGNLFATLTGGSVPNYQTPDTYVTPETILSYPKTIQCRMDTYLNGTLNRNRPACWFKN